jgi:electron transfer flavoprotein beta subunit
MVRVESGKATVQHEVEGGMERVVELDLPAVISVQTGLNEPRYVSIRGIRRVSGTEIPVVSASTLVVAAPGARVRLAALLSPPAGKSAEILEGDTSKVVDVLVERLRENGGI